MELISFSFSNLVYAVIRKTKENSFHPIGLKKIICSERVNKTNTKMKYLFKLGIYKINIGADKISFVKKIMS